jgi:hypothetical protein
MIRLFNHMCSKTQIKRDIMKMISHTLDVGSIMYVMIYVQDWIYLMLSSSRVNTNLIQVRVTR